MRAKIFRKKISLNEALHRLFSYIQPGSVGVEEVTFDHALGRVLAEDIISDFDIPPYDRAAMDGYAVRAENTFGASQSNPFMLKKVEGEVRDGECMPIQTGMRMPEGSNAVIMVEYTKDMGDKVKIFSAVTPGKNVSLRGEDVKKGEGVLRSGKILDAYDIGMLASIARKKVKVYRRAKVGIISTGDELLDPKESSANELEEEIGRGKAKVMDVNSYILEALTKKIAIPRRIGIVKDEYEEIKRKIIHSTDFYDVLLITGGSSVGERDFLADIINDVGELVFHGVSIRPGEPTGFG
ncbi:MAG: molybdopterin molybdotransferase MoeA, partial [Candidatus Methanospirareceae archaeon]